MEKHFRNKVNWISFICAVLVVLLHSYSFNDGAKDTFAFHFEFLISRCLAQVSVPLFFALSAFLFYRNFDYSKLRTKLQSRFHSLIVPYLAWNLISMLAFYFLSRFSFINTAPFSLNLETVIDSLIYYQYNLVFWFVFQLIILTYLFPLLYPLLKHQMIAILLLIFVICMYGSGWRHVGRFEVRALVYYMFGAYFAIHHEKTVVNHQRATVWGILSLASALVLFYSDQSQHEMIKVISRLLLIYSVFDLTGLLANIGLPSIFNCSFPIYAMHNLILEFFNKVFSFILSPDSNLILIDYVFSSVATIMIIVGINRFLLTNMPKVHGFLFGGRGK